MKVARFVLPLILGLSACAAAPEESAQAPPDGRECFNVSMVSGFSDAGEDKVRLRVSSSRQYDLTLRGPQCDDVEWAHAIAVESRPSSWICVGDSPGQGEVRFRDSASRRVVSCYVDSVERVAVEPAG